MTGAVTMLVLLAVPLALLAAMLPLAFVGCEFHLPEGSPPFDDVVNDVPSLVAFWHLNEPSGPTAGDNKGGHDGTYGSGPVAPDPAGPSEGAPGILEFDQPSLVANEPAKRSIKVNGGFVDVPFSPDLNTPEFTMHAFVHTDWSAADPGAFRAVIFNEQSEPGVRRGFSLYANPDNHWEAFVGDGTAFASVSTGAEISLGTTDFLAVTYDGTSLTLYVNGEKRAFAPLVYQPNTSHPLRIGEAIPGPFNPAFPFNGRLQEIAYYDTALEQQDIINIGIASTGL